VGHITDPVFAAARIRTSAWEFEMAFWMGRHGWLASFVVMLGSGVGLAEPVVSEEEWELPAEHLRDNGLRGDVVLNAWWEGRAADSDEVGRFSVPDVWGSRTNYTYSRWFDLPEGWAERRLVLEVDRLSETGVVSLNGEPLAEVRAGVPYVALEIPADRIVPGRQHLSITTALIRGDVWLYSFPRADTVIEDSYLTTSFRRMEVRVDLSGRAPAGSTVRPVVRVFADAEASDRVLEIEADGPVTTDADGVWRAVLTAPWPDAKLWSHWEPNLYWYTVTLSDASGRLTDEVLPRRFGFREVWQDGRQMMLNGAPLHFVGDTWSWLLGSGGNVVREQAEAAMRAMKSVGIHAGWRLNSDVALRVADELGVLVTDASVGGLNIPLDIAPALRPGEAGDDGGDQMLVAGDLEAYRDSQERIRRVIARWREHPSVLGWRIGSPWSRYTLHSRLQGAEVDPWDYWPGNQNVANNRLRYYRASRSAEFVASLDPHRPVIAQNQPGVPIEFSTRYLCDDLDLREREAFFEHYAQSSSRKVLWPSEFAMPFHGHQFIRRQPHQMPQSAIYPTIYVENAARLFGDEVYTEVSDSVLRRWHRTTFDQHVPSPVYQRLTAENVTRVWRGWRTAGISGHAHWVLREGFSMSSERRTSEQRIGVTRQTDPRKPGTSRITGNINNPSSSGFPIPGVDDMHPGGEAYLRAISPLLAYIAGDGSPYNRDHLFTVGDTVRKQVVVLSDYHDTFEITGRWSLEGPDERVAHAGELTLRVEPGMRAIDALPIAFEAPEVDQRTEFTLRVSLSADSERLASLDDRFVITVFPRHRAEPWSFGGRVWYAHPGRGGELESMLEGAGVRNARRLPSLSEIESGDAELPGPHDLLVLPRGFFTDSNRDHDFSRDRLMRQIDLDGLVEQGMRLLVLEQDVSNLFGMNTEHVRPRRAFIAARGHPVFEGLQASDLADWSGRSHLDPDGEVGAITPTMRRFPDRVWHVTTDNTVATRTLIRPQTGAVRALAVSGFDLQESPLLEVAHGRGRMVFCQFDVSDRYGDDPVATRLVDNVLRYLAHAEPPDPSRDRVVHLSSDDAAVEVRPHTFRAEPPSGEAGWGITRAELFFREAMYEGDWVTTRLPDGRVPVLRGEDTSGRPQVIRAGDDGGFEWTLDESVFQTPWGRQKVSFIRAALTANQNGSRRDGPAMGLHGNRWQLYPHPWTTRFVHPYTAAVW
jgi:beta-galactosidase